MTEIKEISSQEETESDPTYQEPDLERLAEVALLSIAKLHRAVEQVSQRLKAQNPQQEPLDTFAILLQSLEQKSRLVEDEDNRLSEKRQKNTGVVTITAATSLLRWFSSHFRLGRSYLSSIRSY